MSAGDHIAVFYRGPTERDALLRSYFDPALAAGEYCACLADEDCAAAIRDLFDGRLTVIGPGDVPPLSRPGFDPHAMARFWRDTIAQATRNGQVARLVGMMTWVVGDEDRIEHLAEFESALAPLIAPYPVLGWCLYDLERLEAGVLLDAARTHRRLFIDGTYIENPHHMLPGCGLGSEGPVEAHLRTSAASLQGILVLGRLMMIAGSPHEIARLCLGAAAALLSGCGIVALAQGDPDTAPGEERWSVSGLSDGRTLPSSTSRALAGLASYLGDQTLQEDSLRLLGYPWSCAIPLRFSGRNVGWLLAACPDPPDGESEVRFLLHALAGQAASALATRRAASANEAKANELRHLSEQLQEAVSERDRLLEVHRRLTDAAVAGTGVAGIAEVIADVLAAPVLVEDATGTVMALAGGSEDFRAGDSERGHIRARLRSEGKLLCAGRIAAQPIMAGGRLTASIWTTASAMANDAGPVAMERAATALKLEMDHERAVAEVELKARGGLTDDLVAGISGPEGEASIRRRARVLGCDLSSVRVAAISPSGSDGDLLRLARALPYPLVTARHDHVIAVIGGDEDPGRLHKVAQEAAGACSVGVGSRCEAPAEAKRSYERALQALEIARPNHAVVCHEDLGVLGVLVAAGDRDTLDEYLQQWLARLLSHDGRHGGQLFDTLTAYLETGGSLAAAAERLHVHVNTVKYRLKRVEKITGTDLSDQDVRFHLRVAVTVARAVGLLGKPSIAG